MRYAMIMAGGKGTRLWPMSREERPKQMLPIVGGRTLLETAMSRLEGLVDAPNRLICTGERFRDLILERMPDLGPEQILGEPVGRDTLNAVGLTAAVLATRDPNAVFVVLTADHLIEPIDEFQRKAQTGFELVEADPRRLVTFAIEPTFPATSYGYVERGAPIASHAEAFEAQAFVEKPDRETAERYVESGAYGWNSGMFVFHAGAVMDALGRYKADTRAGLEEIADAWNTPQRTETLERIYPQLEKISVDYALMEPAAVDPMLQVCVVQMRVSWLDVGSWPSFAQSLEPDADGNRSNVRTHHLGARNITTVGDDPEHTIAVIGCEDLIIVQTADATLVCPASRAEEVKRLAESVHESLR